MTDEPTRLKCNQCTKDFSNTKLLQQHQQMFHTDKAFICETCGKAFRFRSNLAEHRSVHTALKPYVCKFCGKSSRLKGNLTKHILKHHKKEQNESIAKDDIIVKKAPKTFKENGSSAANGTTTTTTTTTTAAITTNATTSVTTASSSSNHNNNNSNNVTNNNHRTIKTEIEDPDYVLTSVKKTAPVTPAKVVPSTPITTRIRAQAKEHTVVATTAPAIVVPVPVVEPVENLLPKDVSTDNDSLRSVLISLGFDYGNSIKLNRQQQLALAMNGEMRAEDMSSSPDTVYSDSDPDYVADSPPPPTVFHTNNNHNHNQNHTVGEATLAAMVVAAASVQRGDGSPDSTDTQKGPSPRREELSPSVPSTQNGPCPSPPNVTQCKECGKHVRKSSHLPIHMTLSHGFPPPAIAKVQEKSAEEMTQEEHLQHELRTIANAICELKAQQASTPRVEQALTYIDSRVGRLEKSLETALNSIYTLVQLQTGMTSTPNGTFQFSTSVIPSLDPIHVGLKRQIEITITAVNGCRIVPRFCC
ncbi:unnamed protein product [Caenorhabditis sp. 36 PRJEB53466]|nr:unnamed protein product [Caenorhabditis sp. 36 PRJEB53466]